MAKFWVDIKQLFGIVVFLLTRELQYLHLFEAIYDMEFLDDTKKHDML